MVEKDDMSALPVYCLPMLYNVEVGSEKFGKGVLPVSRDQGGEVELLVSVA